MATSIRLDGKGDVRKERELIPLANQFLWIFKNILYRSPLVKELARTWSLPDGGTIRIYGNLLGKEPFYKIDIFHPISAFAEVALEFVSKGTIFLYNSSNIGLLFDGVTPGSCHIFKMKNGITERKHISNIPLIKRIMNNTVNINETGIYSIICGVGIEHLLESVAQGNIGFTKFYASLEFRAEDPYTYYKKIYILEDQPYGALQYSPSYGILYAQGQPHCFNAQDFFADEDVEFPISCSDYPMYSNTYKAMPRQNWCHIEVDGKPTLIQNMFMQLNHPSHNYWQEHYSTKEENYVVNANIYTPLHTMLYPTAYIGLKTPARSVSVNTFPVTIRGRLDTWSPNDTITHNTICWDSVKGIGYGKDTTTTVLTPVYSPSFTVTDQVASHSRTVYSIMGHEIPLQSSSLGSYNIVTTNIVDVPIQKNLYNYDPEGLLCPIYDIIDNPGCAQTDYSCKTEWYLRQYWTYVEYPKCKTVQYDREKTTTPVESIRILSHAHSHDGKEWIVLFSKVTQFSAYEKYTYDSFRGGLYKGFRMDSGYKEDFYILTSRHSGPTTIFSESYFPARTRYYTVDEGEMGYVEISHNHDFLTYVYESCDLSYVERLYTNITWITNGLSPTHAATEVKGSGYYITDASTFAHPNYLVCSFIAMEPKPDTGVGAGPDVFNRRVLMVMDLAKEGSEFITTEFTDEGEWSRSMAVGVFGT